MHIIIKQFIYNKEYVSIIWAESSIKCVSKWSENGKMGKNGNWEYLEKRSLKNTVFKGTGGAEKTEETEKRIINTESIEYFKRVLIRNEKSIQTIEKYIRDIKKLMIYSHGQITRSLLFRMNILKSI